jgi:hypothetical protein
MSTAAKPFDMGKMAMGGLGQMLDSVEMVKRAWSSMSLPGNLVPTMDVEELDKRIADLKAVEQWLNMNLSMLHGTIQGLEIQRGTLAAVKAFSASMGEPARGGEPADPSKAAQQRARAAVEAMERAVNTTAAGASRAAPSAAAGRPDAASPPGSAEEDPANTARDASPSGSGAARGGEGAPGAPGVPGLAGLDPNAWWNLLQQNFNQVAEAALSGVALPGAAGNGGEAKRASSRKGGAKSGAGTAAKSGGSPTRRAASGATRAASGKAAARKTTGRQ